MVRLPACHGLKVSSIAKVYCIRFGVKFSPMWKGKKSSWFQWTICLHMLIVKKCKVSMFGVEIDSYNYTLEEKLSFITNFYN